MLTTRAARVLRDADHADVTGLFDADPVTSVFVASRVAAHGISRWRLGAQLWGYAPHGMLSAVCYSGANLVPLTTEPEALAAFAAMATDQGRACSSIVGPAAGVHRIWERLEPVWGPAREIRPRQPLLATAVPPPVPADPAVRRARMSDFDALLPACVAMYTEEVGVSPMAWDGGSAYRARVAELVEANRAYVRIERGQVVFKAELGAVTRRACQVQGVWTHPDWRGRGLGRAGMAAVVADALRTVAPVVSLYVNDFNEPARAIYDRCGFTQVNTFATILF